MKFCLVSLIFILFSFTACEAQKQSPNSNWKEFVSETGNFKVLLPARPFESVKEVDDGGGKQKRCIFVVSQTEKTLMVAYADNLTIPSLTREQLKFYFGNLQSGIVKQSNAKLVGSRDIFLGEKEGREFIFVDDIEPF